MNINHRLFKIHFFIKKGDTLILFSEFIKQFSLPFLSLGVFKNIEVVSISIPDPQALFSFGDYKILFDTEHSNLISLIFEFPLNKLLGL